MFAGLRFGGRGPGVGAYARACTRFRSFFAEIQDMYEASEVPAYIASDHAKRELLFAEMRRLINARPGGRVLRHHLTMLHVARKKP